MLNRDPRLELRVTTRIERIARRTALVALAILAAVPYPDVWIAQWIGV